MKGTATKSVYLTFDDGPTPDATPNVLDILAVHKIKATFFCVGANVERNPHLYQRIINEGHSVGNHTYSHINGWKTSTADYIADVKKCSEVLKSHLFRPPYGRITIKQYRELKKEFSIILWDVLTGDYKINFGGDKCLEVVKKYSRNGSIILFHDSEKSAEKIPDLVSKSIELLKERNYNFKPLSDIKSN